MILLPTVGTVGSRNVTLTMLDLHFWFIDQLFLITERTQSQTSKIHYS